jgi:hypothetical protein
MPLLAGNCKCSTEHEQDRQYDVQSLLRCLCAQSFPQPAPSVSCFRGSSPTLIEQPDFTTKFVTSGLAKRFQLRFSRVFPHYPPMRTLLLATLGILFFLSPVLFAAECRQNPDDGRLRAVEFPDGRRIFVLSHNHGDRVLPFALLKLVRSKELSNAEFRQGLAALGEKVRNAEGQIAQDTETLRQLLKDNPDLKFLAEESTNRIVQNNLENYALLEGGFNSAFKKRGLVPTEDEKRVMRVVLGPVYYIKLHEPERLLGREVLGFETDEANALEDAAEKRADALVDQLDELSKSNGKFISNLWGTRIQLWSLYDTFNPESDIPKIMASVHEDSIPETLRQPTLAWIRATLDDMAGYKRREVDISSGMIKSGKSGILVMGADHLKSLMTRLQGDCTKAEPLMANLTH